MFEKAARLKVRFGTEVGNVAAEDLWDMPLLSQNGVCLDNVAKFINKALKESSEESFVTVKNPVNKLLELKLDIVKHIIKVKLDERKTAKDVLLKKQQKEKILAIISDKEDESLKGMDVEDLKKMVADL